MNISVTILSFRQRLVSCLFGFTSISVATYRCTEDKNTSDSFTVCLSPRHVRLRGTWKGTGSLRNSQFPGFVQREQTTGRLGTDAKSHQCQDVSIGSPSLSSLGGTFSKMMENTHCIDLLFCLVSAGLSSLSSLVGAFSKMMEYTHCIDLCCFVLSSQGCRPCRP